MVKYKCAACGEVFFADEIETVFEDRGEFWGFPCYEEIPVCPNCGDEDFDEYEESEDEP